jgi:succinate dehydrogenase hydrophobic anchor subunit
MWRNEDDINVTLNNLKVTGLFMKLLIWGLIYFMTSTHNSLSPAFNTILCITFPPNTFTVRDVIFLLLFLGPRHVYIYMCVCVCVCVCRKGAIASESLFEKCSNYECYVYLRLAVYISLAHFPPFPVGVILISDCFTCFHGTCVCLYMQFWKLTLKRSIL